MTDKKLNIYKPDKLDLLPTRENARAKYEKLQDDKTEESVQQFENSVEIKIKMAMELQLSFMSQSDPDLSVQTCAQVCSKFLVLKSKLEFMMLKP